MFEVGVPLSFSYVAFSVVKMHDWWMTEAVPFVSLWQWLEKGCRKSVLRIW